MLSASTHQWLRGVPSTLPQSIAHLRCCRPAAVLTNGSCGPSRSGQGGQSRLYHCGAALHRSLQREGVMFDNPEAVTRGKSTWEVFRGWLVLKMFTFDILVNNSLKLYHLSKRVLGTWLTGKLLRLTAFGQFAGGVSERETSAVVRRLAERNISSIWFFSIERDLDDVPVPGSQEEFEKQESSFDEVNSQYLRSIQASAACNCNKPVRFAAVKWTAIVNPHLLNKLNQLLVASEETFLSLSSPRTYTVDRIISLEKLKKAVPESLWKPYRDVGIFDWNKHFSIASSRGLNNLLQLLELKVTRNGEPVTFTDMELEQYKRFIQRLLDMAVSVKQHKVCVLVDAEQTYFQVAIEHLTLHLLSARCNCNRTPFIYNTLQTYLVNSYDKLQTYLESSRQYNIKNGIKVVRGCYMEHERQRARDLGLESPVHPTKPLTDESYHRALNCLMKEVENGTTHIIVASHNKETVQRALEQMSIGGISPTDCKVMFGQLLGMGDNLTYPLASAEHVASKVVPYGHMDDMMPFLSRRANENRGLVRNAQEEKLLYWQELKRRLPFRRGH